MMDQRNLVGVGGLLFALGIGGLLAMPVVAGAEQNLLHLVLSSVIAGPVGLAMLGASAMKTRGPSVAPILVPVLAWISSVALFMLLAVGLGRVNP
jgi:hypothetical protein